MVNSVFDNYEQTLQWMFQQIPMYQRTGKAAYKVDLSMTHRIDEHFKHPHKHFKTIHIAGTNGKGSVSHMLASVLQAAGYKTGLYTSPHLKDFRERIRVDGEKVQKQFVMDFMKDNKSFFMDVKPSFFEMSVAMAFEYFKLKKVDVAVVEVGMGGRLDSTNIIQPEVTAITNIGYDHTQFLGNTLEEIAYEKGGTIKDNVPVVIGETYPSTEKIFRKLAHEHNAPIYFADQEYRLIPRKISDELFNRFDVVNGEVKKIDNLQTDLLGKYQEKNIITALKVIDVLKNKRFVITGESLREGMMNVNTNTGFIGRWYVLGHSPMIICDTGHNREGLQYTIDQLKKLNHKELHFILGFVNDKNLDTILDLFPGNAHYYYSKANIPRAMDEKKLAEKAAEYGLTGETYLTVADALSSAKERASTTDIIFVGGSTFVVSEVI
ncbi:MAG: bifunctional folylpolyglutamate synthase/dihydrofolate synthase [Bacteroidales bacterium]